MRGGSHELPGHAVGQVAAAIDAVGQLGLLPGALQFASFQAVIDEGNQTEDNNAGNDEYGYQKW